MSAIVYDFDSIRRALRPPELPAPEPEPVRLTAVDLSAWVDRAIAQMASLFPPDDPHDDPEQDAMPTFTIRVSQQVFYDVEVYAPNAATALRMVELAIHDDNAPSLDEYGMVESDSDDFEIEAVQPDESVAGNPEFEALLVALLARQAAKKR